MSFDAHVLERALDVVSDVFVVFDRDFRLVYHNEANRAAMRAAGMDPETAVGRHVVEAMPLLEGTTGLREATRALRERVPTEWEEAYGPDVRFRARAFPIDTGGIIVVATNVTAEWKAIEAAQAAGDAAQMANRAKPEFLAALSHELRTPLNAIGGYAELLLVGVRGILSTDQRHDIERIAENQSHLLSIITDILSFARLESGVLEVDTAPMQVAETLKSLEPLFAPQLVNKHLSLVIERPDPALMVNGDRERVRQILLNLLVNAAKFTDAGGAIRVSVQGDAGVVRINVRDTGVGIPPEKLGAIFEPFVHAHRSLAEPEAGTGLGLAISRDLARRMGGDITVESQVGAGSTFTLSLQRA